jgi:hypothetical protein
MNENIEKIESIKLSNKVIKAISESALYKLEELKRNLVMESENINIPRSSSSVETPNQIRLVEYNDLMSNIIEQLRKINKKINKEKDELSKYIIHEKDEASIENEKDKSSFNRVMFGMYKSDMKDELERLESGVDDLLKLRSTVMELKMYFDDDVSRNQCGFVRKFNLHFIFLNILSLFFFILYIEIYLDSSLYCTIV